MMNIFNFFPQEKSLENYSTGRPISIAALESKNRSDKKGSYNRKELEGNHPYNKIAVIFISIEGLFPYDS
jgi:hypothetical protein